MTSLYFHMTTVKNSICFFHICYPKCLLNFETLFFQITEIRWVSHYYKKIANEVMNSTVLHVLPYADTNKNSHSRSFSQNMHFELKYLENGKEFLKFKLKQLVFPL